MFFKRGIGNMLKHFKNNIFLRCFFLAVVQTWCSLQKEKRQQSLFQIISVFFCGMDGTRTRDPLRDRQVF